MAESGDASLDLHPKDDDSEVTATVGDEEVKTVENQNIGPEILQSADESLNKSAEMNFPEQSEHTRLTFQDNSDVSPHNIEVNKHLEQCSLDRTSQAIALSVDEHCSNEIPDQNITDENTQTLDNSENIAVEKSLVLEELTTAQQSNNIKASLSDQSTYTNSKFPEQSENPTSSEQIGNEKTTDFEQISYQYPTIESELNSDEKPKVSEQCSDEEPVVSEQLTDEKSIVTEQEADEKPASDLTKGADAQLAGNEQCADEKPTESTADEEQSEKEEYMDILGNKTLLKKVIEAGTGNRPKMGDEVILHLLPEIPEIDKVLTEQQLQYVLGDGDVVQALELAVALMNVGEKAVIISGYKYMYGEIGLKPDVPPKSNFKLTVHLIANNGPLDYPSMNFTTRFGHAMKKKERGNELVKRKEYFLALNSYTKASRIVDPALGCVFKDESPKKLQELLEFRAIVLCNASLVNYKLEAFDAAVKTATEAYKLWPSYSKAYWRLAMAQEKLGNLEESIRSYKLALKYDPNSSKHFNGEIERLAKLLKEKKEMEKLMYSKMFWGAKPPEMDKQSAKPQERSLSSWFWKTGATVIGASLVGMAGIGIYKYLNH